MVWQKIVFSISALFKPAWYHKVRPITGVPALDIDLPAVHLLFSLALGQMRSTVGAINNKQIGSPELGTGSVDPFSNSLKLVS